MEINKEFLTERIATDRGVESSGEYVLPDYLGDVKKLLLTRATPVITGQYRNGGSVDVSGVVRYDIVYLDSEDCLTEASFTTDFDSSHKVEESYADSLATAELSGYTVRLKGPRRLSPTAKLDILYRILEGREYRIDGDTFTRDAVITECKTVESASSAYARCEEREYKEELGGIEGAILDEVKVLATRAEARNITVDRRDGGCEVSADIFVETLVEVKGEMPHTMRATLSYMSQVSEDVFSEDMEVTPLVRVTRSSAEADVSDGGVIVTATIGVCADCIGEENTRIRLVSDCYSTEEGVENSTGAFDYTRHLTTELAKDKVTEEVPRDALGENVRNILFLSATPEINCDAIDENGVSLTGKIRFSGIACQINEDGTPIYEPLKVDLPYSSYVNYNLHNPAKTAATLYVSVTDAACELGDGKIVLSCTLDTAISLAESSTAPAVLTSTLTGERFTRDPSLITVYYPKPDETLFEVAKMFHTSPAGIAKDNDLSDEVFSIEGSRSALSLVHSLIIK